MKISELVNPYYKQDIKAKDYFDAVFRFDEIYEDVGHLLSIVSVVEKI
ncbi:hypothetical protein [Pseudobutyrivibrio sp. YE44]|nr:hypothetical protein [Pseudobutyrivibrio sp. YE44]